MQEVPLPLYTAQDEEIQRLKTLVHRLLGDSRIGDSLLGPFPSADAAQGLRRTDGMFYQSGSLGVYSEPSKLLLSDNALYATPFYLPSVPNLIDEIAIYTTEAGTGSARLGIYDDDGSLHPGRLILDAGTVDCQIPLGKKVLTVNKSLPRGLKWLALLHNVVAGVETTAIFPAAGGWNLLGCGPDTLTSLKVGWWQINFDYAPLPSVYPAGAKTVSTPCIYLSFKPGGWS